MDVGLTVGEIEIGFKVGIIVGLIVGVKFVGEGVGEFEGSFEDGFAVTGELLVGLFDGCNFALEGIKEGVVLKGFEAAKEGLVVTMDGLAEGNLEGDFVGTAA